TAKDQSPPAATDQVEALLDPKFQDAPRPGIDWPMQGATPDRAGLLLLDPPLAKGGTGGLKLPLELVWKLPTGDRSRCAPAIRDGRVFAGSDSGKIFLVDLKTGNKLTEIETPGKIRGSPAAASDLAYIGGDDGALRALEPKTGKIRWTFQAGGP